ncbi:MAG: M90 family metallopeptidase [Planctomycetota bacterium]|nr:M90 family metallopeptidase [Planctomycetota bacterium]
MIKSLLKKLFSSSKPAVFQKEWSEVLGRMEFVKGLNPSLRKRLEQLVATFVDETNWEGRGGLEVTDEMRVTVAGQACRLILALEDEPFRWVRTVYLFPSTYSVAEMTIDEGGAPEEKRSHRHGEAWFRGPVVLSWNATKQGIANPDDGKNVVYHEFAHKLDMLDGFADGTPSLEGDVAYEAWVRIVGSEYRELVEAKERGKKTLLSKYGATNTAEFFAVATEEFFERPDRLSDRHEELYWCLCRFYNQDPARGRVRMR